MRLLLASHELVNGQMAVSRAGKPWSREELLFAIALYCRTPFGRIHGRNQEIVSAANALGRSTGSLCKKMLNLASLDESIKATGCVGLKHASRADKELWEEMNADWEAGALLAEKMFAKFTGASERTPATCWDSGFNSTDTESETIRKSRVGQDFFRRAVFNAYGGKCCISALSVPSLLVASHIVPWHKDRANRLNPSNGLLLSALHDKAFDKGLLTLDPDLTVRVARPDNGMADGFFGSAINQFAGQRITLPNKFGPNLQFLAWHRTHVFKG